MDEPFTLVLNPRAGAGAARRRLPALERALSRAGARYEVALTEAPGHATVLVREALESGQAGVAVVGGDGTLNEAVNGFVDADGEPIREDAWLAPLPIGTGGDFRRTVGISKRVEAMVTRMLWATPRRIDLGWLTFVDHEANEGHRAFVNIASFGLGGLVDQAVSRGPKWLGGRPAFLLATFQSMIGYQNPEVRLTLDDGEPRVVPVLNVAVANGRYFGGGMMVAPHAEIDDGWFDVVGIELGVRETVGLTPHIYRGTHLDRPGTWSARARRVHAEPVEPDREVLLDVDGEQPGRLPATFELKPGALLLRG